MRFGMFAVCQGRTAGKCMQQRLLGSCCTALALKNRRRRLLSTLHSNGSTWNNITKVIGKTMRRICLARKNANRLEQRWCEGDA